MRVTSVPRNFGPPGGIVYTRWRRVWRIRKNKESKLPTETVVRETDLSPTRRGFVRPAPRLPLKQAFARPAKSERSGLPDPHIVGLAQTLDQTADTHAIYQLPK